MSTEVMIREDNQSHAIVEIIQRAATDSSFDLEKLDRLLTVKERWEAEEARKAFVKALADFKQDPPRLVKDQTADFPARGGRVVYSYPSLGDVASRVAGALSTHGLSHGWSVEQTEGKVKVTCTLTHKLGHSDSVAIEGPYDESGSKNGIQQIGSTISYLQRYTLMSITGLAAHEMDDDGRSAAAPRQDARHAQRQQEHRSQQGRPAADNGGEGLPRPDPEKPKSRLEQLQQSARFLSNDKDERIVNMGADTLGRVLVTNHITMEEASNALGIPVEHPEKDNTQIIVGKWLGGLGDFKGDRTPRTAASICVLYAMEQIGTGKDAADAEGAETKEDAPEATEEPAADVAPPAEDKAEEAAG